MAKSTKATAKKQSAKSKEQKLSDLVYIQTKLEVPKNQHNAHRNFDYRSAESILAAAKPHLKERNCSVRLYDDIVMIGERYYVKAIAELRKEDVTIEGAIAFAREPQSKTGMDDAQVTGSSSSYARKYALSGLFAINDEKDPDGNETPEPTPKPKVTPPKNNTGNQKPKPTPPKPGTTDPKPYKPSEAQKKYIGDMLKKDVFTDADREHYRDKYEHLSNGRETSDFIKKIKAEKKKREDAKK